MKKDEKYAVIGGQYQDYFYGFTDSLHAAKILATKNEEYWDNFQGWHKPQIYRAEDVHECENFYGHRYAPNEYAEPVITWDACSKKWASYCN